MHITCIRLGNLSLNLMTECLQSRAFFSPYHDDTHILNICTYILNIQKKNQNNETIKKNSANHA